MLKITASAISWVALLAFTSQAMAGAMPISPPATLSAETAVVEVVVRHGGGGRNVHVNRGANFNRNAHINRNVNVNRNVHRNVNVNRNINVNRNVHVNRGIYRGPNVYYHGGRWARPGAYWWPVGGAIAAGAAIGFVSAAAAATWAGQAPGPNYCWYYTDASQRQGFWDVCQ
jgi:hypothetical protein